jgi:hypothetical protein
MRMMSIRYGGVIALIFASAAVSLAHHPIINEIVANHEGLDTNEFIEIIFLPDTDLSVFTLLVIEGDSEENPGRIDAAYQIGVTDENALWWTGFIDDELEDGSASYLLVLRFEGAVGDDIDTDNDGVIDQQSWTWVSDEVGVFDGGEEDLNYADSVLGVGLPRGGTAVGGASRIPNGVDNDSAADWRRNAFNGEGIKGLPGGIVDPREAINTPGESNRIPDFDPPRTWTPPTLYLRVP